MTRKDYVKLASAIAVSKPAFYYDVDSTKELMDVWVRTAHAIADVLQGDNWRFDRERFLEAATVLEPSK